MRARRSGEALTRVGLRTSSRIQDISQSIESFIGRVVNLLNGKDKKGKN